MPCTLSEVQKGQVKEKGKGKKGESEKEKKEKDKGEEKEASSERSSRKGKKPKNDEQLVPPIQKTARKRQKEFVGFLVSF